jgi:hypothetical protein
MRGLEVDERGESRKTGPRCNNSVAVFNVTSAASPEAVGKSRSTFVNAAFPLNEGGKPPVGLIGSSCADHAMTAQRREDKSRRAVRAPRGSVMRHRPREERMHQGRALV